MTGPRRGHVALAFHRRDLALDACDRLDCPAHLAVTDRGVEDALTSVANPVAVHRAAPAEFRADGDLAEVFGFAGQQARRLVLVDHHERRAESAGGVLDQLALPRIVDRVEART